MPKRYFYVQDAISVAQTVRGEVKNAKAKGKRITVKWHILHDQRHKSRSTSDGPLRHAHEIRKLQRTEKYNVGSMIYEHATDAKI